MIRKILFVLLFFSTTMQAGYVIQLGLYKNRLMLQKMVDRIAQTKLKSNVTIEKLGELHWAHSQPIEDKVSAQRALLHYRKVFKDAFIKEVSAKQNQKKEQTNIPVVLDQMVSKKGHAKRAKKRSLETLLNGNVFYVCFEAADKELVIVAFDGDYIEYNTIIGDIPSFKERYNVINNRLYTFKEKVSQHSVYSTLEEVKEKYLLISSWHKNEKVNSIRYYYKLEDALAYVKRG
ncbi:hypothetical protein PGH07_09160 [Sulfurovum sp. zt1-1]|uniref:Uncharacterized protein n=1 Tax=Sulfurovum zhangzhouensis TaxID=3019067 RepID=A0ABT7QZU1_9BACT|nr:hypothetical protein [Sulfurovum zhangzhouensis]MDM5272350.1 hypothetical protein [Sulfurovum zhangzhouensis]